MQRSHGLSFATCGGSLSYILLPLVVSTVDVAFNIKVTSLFVILKGLAQAKIIKKSVILFWLLNITI